MKYTLNISIQMTDSTFQVLLVKNKVKIPIWHYFIDIQTKSNLWRYSTLQAAKELSAEFLVFIVISSLNYYLQF